MLFRSSAKRCRKSLAALEKLQVSLGMLNDIANRQTLFDLGNDGPDPVTRPMPKLGPGEEKALLKTARHAYARFAEIRAFWQA